MTVLVLLLFGGCNTAPAIPLLGRPCTAACQNLVACDLLPAELGVGLERCEAQCRAATSLDAQAFTMCAGRSTITAAFDGGQPGRREAWCDENLCPAVARCFRRAEWSSVEVPLVFTQGPVSPDRCTPLTWATCGPRNLTSASPATTDSLCGSLGIRHVTVWVTPLATGIASPRPSLEWTALTCEEAADPAAFSGPLDYGAYSVEVRVTGQPPGASEPQCVRHISTPYVINEACSRLQLALPAEDTWSAWEPCPDEM